MRRHGFTLVELLVVIGIIMVLLAMLLPAVALVQAAAKSSLCLNNMRQVGLALHQYHQDHLAFPAAKRPYGPVDISADQSASPYDYVYQPETRHVHAMFWRDLAIYLEGKAPLALPCLACPLRHTKEHLAQGWLVDYGAAVAAPYPGSPAAAMPILDQRRVTLEQLETVDGASTTFLLSHKGADPDIALLGWNPVDPMFSYVYWAADAQCEWAWKRFGHVMLRDEVGGYNIPNYAPAGFPYRRTPAPCYQLMTSPHEGGNPTLYADGSVRMVGFSQTINYSYANPGPEHVLLLKMWNWNDGPGEVIEH